MTAQEALAYLRARLLEIQATPTRARPRWSARDVEALSLVAPIRLITSPMPITRIPPGLSAAMVEAIALMHDKGDTYLNENTRWALDRRGIVTVGPRSYLSRLTAYGIEVALQIQGRG